MLTCPRCLETMDAPAATIRTVSICLNRECGASFVIVDGDKTRLAIGSDTIALSADELATLKKARGRTR
jgi:hypothetical protein